MRAQAKRSIIEGMARTKTDHILNETPEEKQRLLDTFAAAGLIGYLASCSAPGVRTPPEEEAAQAAYNFAAAMIDERASRDEIGEYMRGCAPKDEAAGNEG